MMLRSLCAGITVLALASPAYPKTLDVCFSPKGHCDQVLVSWIQSGERTIDAAIYTLTDPRITQALIEAHRKGLRVRVVKEARLNLTESAVIKRFKEAGVPIRLQKGSGGGLQHNKFMIIDEKYVVTGSFNWTRSATGRNDENFVVLDDTAPRFTQEFTRLWNTR